MKFPLLLIVILISGCQWGNQPSARLDNYLYRLANSLKLEQPEAGIDSALKRYPGRRELLYKIPPAEINILEFLRLSSCDLQRLIGQRNSSLGKLMKGSQALLYEYQFIKLAETCLTSLKPESQLHGLLTAELQNKKQNLQRVRWNATFGSEEMQHLFSLSTRALNQRQLRDRPVELLSALTTLQRFVNNADETEKTVEGAYAVLSSSKRLGELRLTMEMAVNYLTIADELIQQRLRDKPLCHNNQPNSQFEIVNSVFMKFYIGDVQPLIAKLHQQAGSVLTALDKLQRAMEPAGIFTQFWNKVYASDNSEWQTFEKAIERHTANWQQLLRQCGRLPA